MVTCVGNLPCFIAFSFYCDSYSNLKLLIFLSTCVKYGCWLPAHIQDLGVLVFSDQHIFRMAQSYVHIVHHMEMECLNKINLWMMENVF